MTDIINNKNSNFQKNLEIREKYVNKLKDKVDSLYKTIRLLEKKDNKLFYKN